MINTRNEGDVTWNDIVRKYFPDADDMFCEFILWEHTAFPVASAETVETQIIAFKEAA